MCRIQFGVSQIIDDIQMLVRPKRMALEAELVRGVAMVPCMKHAS